METILLRKNHINLLDYEQWSYTLGDYDNDGDLDILFNGIGISIKYSNYQNYT